LCAEMPWTDQLSALQSAPWVAAVVWADGECWTDQFAPERIVDPAVGEVAANRVVVAEDTALPQGACRLTARTADASTRILEVRSPLGGPDRPLTAADVTAKLERAAGGERAARILEAIHDPAAWSFDVFAALLSEADGVGADHPVQAP
jgi:2-methylcitrate dehydratase PrpD